MLSQGVLSGAAIGFMQVPAFAAVGQFFDKKRAAAYGIIVSGSSVGGIVIPIVLAKLLNETSLGFGWSVRIVGFVIIPFMLFGCFVVKARLPPRHSKFWIAAAYKNKMYMLLVASLFFVFTGMFTPLFYIPTYAVQRGVSPALAGYMIAIINGASTFGRVIPGVLADKYGRVNMYIVGSFCTTILVFVMNETKSTAAIVVYSIFFGFASGTIISGASVVFSVCPKDPRDIGTYGGMGLAISGFGILVGPPVNGVLINHFGGFYPVSIFSGVMCLFGSFVAIFIKLATPQGLLGRV